VLVNWVCRLYLFEIEQDLRLPHRFPGIIRQQELFQGIMAGLVYEAAEPLEKYAYKDIALIRKLFRYFISVFTSVEDIFPVGDLKGYAGGVRQHAITYARTDLFHDLSLEGYVS